VIAARRGVEVKTSFVVPNVVASLILGVFLAWAPSAGDMVAGNGPGTFTGIGSHKTAGKVSLTDGFGTETDESGASRITRERGLVKRER